METRSRSLIRSKLNKHESRSRSRSRDKKDEEEINYENYLQLARRGQHIISLHTIPDIGKYVLIPSVQRSFKHFLDLIQQAKEEEEELQEKKSTEETEDAQAIKAVKIIKAVNSSIANDGKKAIEQYKGDTDYDDLREQMLRKEYELKGPLDFRAINEYFRLSTFVKFRDIHQIFYRMDLVAWIKQLLSCVDLIFALYDFPKVLKSDKFVVVYRGQQDYSFYEHLERDSQFTIPSFFSTSLNKITAFNFSKRGSNTKIEIIIPEGFLLPFINDKLTYLSNYEGGNESEVLLPPRCKFQYIGRFEDTDSITLKLLLINIPNIKNRERFKTKFIENNARKIIKADSHYYRETTPQSTQEFQTQPEYESQPEDDVVDEDYEDEYDDESKDYNGKVIMGQILAGGYIKTKRKNRKTKRKNKKTKRKTLY